MTESASSAGPRWGYAASGVLATGVGLGIGHLASALLAPGSSPLLAVGSRAIDLTPGPVKDWAIASFGTADKVVLLIGAAVVTLALGALAGLAARASLGRGVAVGALLASVALVAAGVDPGRPALWFLPALIACGMGSWALSRLTRLAGALPTAPPLDAVDDRRQGRARRDWFKLGAVVGGAGVLGWLGGEGLRAGVGGVRPPVAPPPSPLPSRSVTPFPAGLESEVGGLSRFVTPTADFFRIDTALGAPAIDAASWRLQVTGLVERPFSIGWDELLALEAVERPVTLECVSNEVGGELIGSARWLGVRTRDLLNRAGVKAGADMVFSTSADGFTVSTPLDALLDDRGALVAYGMNGEALPPLHGYPARLITPGLYGFVGATKWLVSLEVTTFGARQAYWTTRGWADRAPIKPGSRIEVPRSGSTMKAGPIKVGGTAWAHGVGVGGVQVRVDGGPWSDARLGPEAGVQYWRQWLWTWDAVPGEHVLDVRVIGAGGVPQSEIRAAPAPDGASGLHSIRVSVTTG